MRRVGEAVQKADRHALDGGRGEALGERFDRALVERRDDAPARIDALGDNIP